MPHLKIRLVAVWPGGKRCSALFFGDKKINYHSAERENKSSVNSNIIGEAKSNRNHLNVLFIRG